MLTTNYTPGYRSLTVAASVTADWTAARGRAEFRTRLSQSHFGNGNGIDDFVTFRDASDNNC